MRASISLLLLMLLVPVPLQAQDQGVAAAWSLTWDEDWVTAVTFVGKSRRVIAGNKQGHIVAWDIPEKGGEPLPPPVRRFDGHTNQITALAATPDGRWLVSTSYDHTVRLWDLESPPKSKPEEVYFRYYLRFGDDWQQTVQGGKMPGLSGTYGKAGWGGRKVNGKDGWSARGSFGLTLPEGNPLAGKQPLGWYCYHADMEGNYGSIWYWTQGYRGFLDNNRWYCIEQYVKMNTPGKDGGKGARDGILRIWIDGRPAYEKTDLRFRDVDTLKIEQVWMNVYHGGTTPAPRDQHLYVDNVVVARKYIGPRK